MAAPCTSIIDAGGVLLGDGSVASLARLGTEDS
jgi:hypothetical protein